MPFLSNPTLAEMVETRERVKACRSVTVHARKKAVGWSRTHRSTS
jgi:hypothetical protein